MKDALDIMGPSISFVTIMFVAQRFARVSHQILERFLQWFLGFDDYTLDEDEDDARAPARPGLVRAVLKSAGWAFHGFYLSIAIVCWRIFMASWFWVPPWLETYWPYVAAGLGVGAAVFGLGAIAGTIAAKLSQPN